jgi:hypothetical protein
VNYVKYKGEEYREKLAALYCCYLSVTVFFYKFISEIILSHVWGCYSLFYEIVLLITEKIDCYCLQEMKTEILTCRLLSDNTRFHENRSTGSNNNTRL